MEVCRTDVISIQGIHVCTCITGPYAGFLKGGLHLGCTQLQSSQRGREWEGDVPPPMQSVEAYSIYDVK